VLEAHDAGFDNISCDLMLATPGQTEALLAETLEVLNALPITHVSAYMLQIEEGTPLSKDAALLSGAGGIVQGMSGSPILQNGRLVGAVTHVFVKDPTRGYGIFAENMFAQTAALAAAA
jgi:hypothetical protein